MLRMDGYFLNTRCYDPPLSNILLAGGIFCGGLVERQGTARKKAACAVSLRQVSFVLELSVFISTRRLS
jgi:hypothetical protein